MIKKLERVRDLLHEGTDSSVSMEDVIGFKFLDKETAVNAVDKGFQGVYADRITSSAARILEENLIMYEYLEKAEDKDSSD